MVAEPSDVETVTEVATSTGWESETVKVIGPAFSAPEAAATLKTALSSLVIVPVAVPLVPLIVTLRPLALRPPSVTLNVSSASTLVSAVGLTVKVCEVSPAAKVSV